MAKQECITYVNSDYAGDPIIAGLQWVCIYILPSTDELELYFIVYCRFVFYGGRVYDHDECYEGGNLASRVT